MSEGRRERFDMLTSYRRFKKSTSLRKFASPRLVYGIKATEQAVLGMVRQFQPVVHHTRFQAICHIGMQKTGTVWFREMLSDIEIYKSAGLHFKDCSGKTLPENTHLRGIYSPIRRFDDDIRSQLNHADIATIAVIRDPVALVLSWLKSTTGYHVSKRGDAMSVRRQELSGLNKFDQIQYAVNFLKSKNRFQQFEDLIAFAKAEPSRVLVKYEDCIHNTFDTFREMFRQIDIKMDDQTLEAFISRHSFKAYTGRSITDSSTHGSPLQGRTHLEAARLPDIERELIIQAVGEGWASQYGYR